MTIEVSLLMSGISIAFAIFFGISTRNRALKQDTREEARNSAEMMVKMENIQSTLIEFKTEMRNDREEMNEVKKTGIQNEASLKSLHKRIDRMEELLQMSTHHTEL